MIHTVQTGDKVLSFLNSQSVVNKKASLAVFIKDHNPDILFISETWLSPSTEIFHSHYNVIRKGDRTDGYGGVLIAYRNTLVCYEVNCDSYVELVACRFVLKDHSLIVC